MKKISIIILMLLIGTISVLALTNTFSINTSSLSIVTDNKKDNILSVIDKDYLLSSKIEKTDEALDKEITELAKKTTFLLIGEFNNTDETSEEYYQRKEAYLDLRYAPDIPKDENNVLGYDTDSEEFEDDMFTGIAVPSMFVEVDKLKIIYSSFGDIKVSKRSDEEVIAVVVLPNATYNIQSIENPMEYTKTKSNIVFYYQYKKLKDEYKLYYLTGYTGVEAGAINYSANLEEEESKGTVSVAPIYQANINDNHDLSKLNNLDKETINKINETNKNNIVYLQAYYNNYVVSTANGFFIDDGLIITTWSFLEESLSEAQYITIKDTNGTSYAYEGIVTANPDVDIAVIKLEEEISNKVKLGDHQTVAIEDAVIAISSKTGVGLTSQAGIVISTDGYFQTSILLTETDQGSPLFDIKGNVIGINTSQQINTSFSIANNSSALKEVQDKFKDIEFNSIKTVSFETLKEQFYYVKYNQELINNNISKSKWKKYSQIGNVEETINLPLIKASYANGAISLRYQNEIKDYISSMQLSSSFKEQLIKEGYKEVLNGTKKCIYQNNKYKVIIMDEFNYLIVVMVKL